MGAKYLNGAVLTLAVPLLLAGCAQVARRSYTFPADEVALAAHEAAIAAGFVNALPGPDRRHIEGTRKLLVGFAVGQGGEKLAIDLREAGERTDVTIRSRKDFLNFLMQRHRAGLVAEYIDQFVRENAAMRVAAGRARPPVRPRSGRPEVLEWPGEVPRP